MFNFDKWKDENVVMHCKTQEEAEAFCKEMDEAGLTWHMGRRYSESNNFEEYKENTCYNFNRGLYGSVEYYKDRVFKILEYSDYMNKPKAESRTKSAYETSIKEMMSHCESVLIEKHREYATNDDFHNFNVAAELQGITPLQALVGMMDKHVVSVHDYVNEHAEGRKTTPEQWKEKIGDNINYLLILWAMVNQEVK